MSVPSVLSNVWSIAQVRKTKDIPAGKALAATATTKSRVVRREWKSILCC